MILRFANAIFEPLWNRKYIDHVQIAVAESLGVENRAGYYEQACALRDMFQNHMLQMLALVAMEPPVIFGAKAYRDEKIKLLQSIWPFAVKELDQWVVRSQYGSGHIDGQPVSGYRAEKGVNDNSLTETYVACKIMIDNWRWQGVKPGVILPNLIHSSYILLATPARLPPIGCWRTRKWTYVNRLDT